MKKCKCKRKMNKICNYTREDFANYTTVEVYWCEHCGTLLKDDGHMKDWYVVK